MDLVLEDQYKNVFKPFFRLDKVKPNQSGVGLGLAIVEGIVNLMEVIFN